MFMSEINSTDHNSIVSRHFPDEDFRMTEFFFPILEHFCPLFIQIAQMGLILPRWGLILPRSPPPNPIHYSAVTPPFLGSPPQNTPFPWKLAKWTTVLAIWTPTGQNVWKVGKTFLDVGKKKLFMIFVKLIVNQLSLKEIISWLRLNSQSWKKNWTE